MNKQKRPGLFLQIAGVLLCLCMVSTHFATGLYAKYTNRAQGSDAARAAKFIVSAEITEEAKTTSGGSETGSGEIEPGEEGELPGMDLDDTPAEGTDAALTRKYKAVLKNGSEVAVAASIRMIFSKGVDIELLNGNAVDDPAHDIKIEEEIVLNGPYYIAPGETREVEFTLTFSPSSAFDVSSINNAMDPLAKNADGEYIANEDLSSVEYQLPYNAIVTFIQVD